MSLECRAFSRLPRVVTGLGTLLLLGAGGTACGSSNHGGDPHGDHAPLPQLAFRGGPVIASPHFVSVTFAGDPLAPSLDAFGQTLASSPWWDTVRAGFCPPAAKAAQCVGQGPPGTSVQLSTPAPASLTDSDQGMPSTLQSFLAGAVGAGSLPAPDPGNPSSTIYVLYFPGSTRITFDNLTSCADGGFAGYHNQLQVQGQTVSYAVIVECAPLLPPIPSVTPLTVLQSTTVTSSHEGIETATDPDGATGWGLDLNDTANWAWIDVAGGNEVADLCIDPFGINQDVTPSGSFSAQRIWSNTAAAASHDPCVPAPTDRAYFNAAPSKSFFVLDVGQSTTFDVDTFADGPTANWTLAAQDWSSPTTTFLDLSIAGATQTSTGPTVQVNRGETVKVTVTLLADPGSLPTGEADGALVSLQGSTSTGIVAHWWPFAVMSHTDAINTGIQPAARHAHRPLRASMARPALLP
jgi:hypothetical protein